MFVVAVVVIIIIIIIIIATAATAVVYNILNVHDDMPILFSIPKVTVLVQILVCKYVARAMFEI